VLYLGTFSKVLFPSLRLGYLVVPPDLIEAFTAAHALVDRQSPTPDQAVLARFISEGHFVRHIRRMRTLYASRQAALLEAVNKQLKGLVEIAPAEAGLHLIAWLPDWLDDRTASEKALAYGIEVVPLSSYCIEPYPRNGLLLGYAAFNEHAIVEGVKRLKSALTALARSQRGTAQPPR
jgi:GntR family transcriptional regulator/MocR family aminotransferase